MSERALLNFLTLNVGILSIVAAGCSAKNHVLEPNQPLGDGSTADSLAQAETGLDESSGFHLDSDTCDPATTVLTGTVYAPTKINPDPLYNAIVYVPQGPILPFKEGVSCDKCGALDGTKALTSTLTAADGKFKLKNVPGGDVTLVIQLGRWRRVVTVPGVKKCVETALPPDLTRLPRNKSEGNIPLTAIATGQIDPLECVLRKMGIDDTEFTLPWKDGRIHMFKHNGADIGSDTPAGDILWSSVDRLKKYDLVVFPCEAQPLFKGAAAAQNVIDYTAIGGRVLATHFSYTWIKNAPAPFPGTASWTDSSAFISSPLTAQVDMTFPKGAAMAQWLKNVGASSDLGVISITDPRIDVDAVNPPSQRWISAAADSSHSATLQHYTFNTPVDAKPEDQCGRVVFSDFHVAKSSFGGKNFPAECGSISPLTPQEKVIEFMLFDLASCVQNDKDPPKPPQ
ncbi:MAG: hypothetical protein NVS3B20_00200 [Polyangiales bacterium]